MNPVAMTGLLVAALRAEESLRPDRLFDDPFAATLAGEAGIRVLAGYRQNSGAMSAIPIIELRTRWYDEAIARATAAGFRQVVVLAAGMDARAYRLAWPNATRVFELDQPDVLAHKQRALADARPRCTRVAVAVDLAGDWEIALRDHAFDPDAPTLWLIEGLLQYLAPSDVERLFARLDALSSARSRALYDVVGRGLLDAPRFAPMLAMMRQLGAPWLFGTDEPHTLLPAWHASITDPAALGRAWNRWPAPPPSPDAASPTDGSVVARGYLVESLKP